VKNLYLYNGAKIAMRPDAKMFIDDNFVMWIVAEAEGAGKDGTDKVFRAQLP